MPRCGCRESGGKSVTRSSGATQKAHYGPFATEPEAPHMTEPTYPIAQPRSLWMRVLMMLLMAIAFQLAAWDLAPWRSCSWCWLLLQAAAMSACAALAAAWGATWRRSPDF